MQITIFLLLACTGVLAQEASQQSQQSKQDVQERMGAGYVTSIVHGDSKDGHNNAQSSVKVNMQSSNNNFHQNQPVQQNYPSPNQYAQPVPYQKSNNHVYLHYQKELKPQTFNNNYQHPEKQPGQVVYQQQSEPLPVPQMIYQIHPMQHGNPIKYSGPKGPSIIHSLASPKLPQMYESKVLSKKEPSQQLYNVGYSINIENSTPKLIYRAPRPAPNAHSYRQQKILHADVITGMHKDKVEKPNDFSHADNGPAHYLTADSKDKQETAASFEAPEKQQLTQVYSDVKNQHGYTWKSVSPSVEISGYHSLNAPYSAEQSQSFDHEAALGRSQGFDMSNVVENGKKPYKGVSVSTEAKGFDNSKDQTINVDTEKKEATTKNVDEHKYLEASNSQLGSNIQHFDIDKYFETQKQPTEIQGFDISKYLEATKSGKSNPGFDVGLTDFSTSTNNYQTTPYKFDNSQKYDFGSQFQNGGYNFFNYQSEPYKTNFFSGHHEEFDKSLLNNFYKSYKPALYSPEFTLSNPGIPQTINVGLQHASSNQNSVQIPTYDLKLPAEYDQAKTQYGQPKNQYEASKIQLEEPKQQFSAVNNQYVQMNKQYEQNMNESPKNQFESFDYKNQDEGYQSAPREKPQSYGFHPQQVNEHFQTSQTIEPQPESQMMIQQHYAYVQAEGAQQPQAQALTQGYEASKPVMESHYQEKFQGEQSQEYKTIQLPKDFQNQENQQYLNIQIPNENKQIEHYGSQEHKQIEHYGNQEHKQIEHYGNQEHKQIEHYGNQEYKPIEHYGNHEHKKYVAHSGNSRPHTPRSVMYENNYRLKTNLRPPPMLIIRQKH